jgi:hypothetical protein
LLLASQERQSEGRSTQISCASMPGHLRDHLAEGRHIPGIFVPAAPLLFGELLDELQLIWVVSLPGEFQDQIV